MINEVILMGRLVADPTLKITQSKKEVVNFSIAVERVPFKSGDSKKEIDYIDIIAWEHTARFVANFLKKGTTVVVVGRLQQRKYDDEGKRRYTYEVIARDVKAAEKRDAQKANDFDPRDFEPMDMDDPLPW